MRILTIAAFLMFLQSCAIIKWAKNSPNTSDVLVATKSNKDLWLGKSSEELILHPVFAARVMDRRKASAEVELITFKNSGGFEGKNNLGMFGSVNTREVEVACSHIFYLKKDVIYDYQRVGSCTEEEDPSFAPIIQK
jgi:hypothetical protein